MSSVASRFPPDRDPLRPPPAPGLGRGFGFAMVAHIALVVALSFGVSWRSTQIPALEAELWSAVPQAVAPKEQAPPETPRPEPKPEPRPEPPKPQTPSAQEVQAQRDAEIAIAKAKQRKQQEEEAEREAQEKKRKLAKQKEEEAEKKAQDEKKRKEEERKEAQAKKDEAAKKDKAQKEADAKREALRQENLRRIMGQADATGGPSATGTAARSSGPSSTYAGRIKARVRPNIIYNDPGGVANPEAEVEVRAAPDGTIIARKIVKSSGLPDFDAAVLRALDRTEILPRDVDGTVPKVMIITFRPRE